MPGKRDSVPLGNQRCGFYALLAVKERVAVINKPSPTGSILGPHGEWLDGGESSHGDIRFTGSDRY